MVYVFKEEMLEYIDALCSVDGCNAKVKVLVLSRKYRPRKLLGFCEQHYRQEVAYEEPEYVEECPNCKCMFVFYFFYRS